jgi:ABC-type transporter Mla MlaB component
MSLPTPVGPIRMAHAGIRLAVTAEVTRAGIPALCADLADRLGRDGDDLVICDVAGVARPDVVTIEALARLCLTARRHGARLVVAGADPRLLDLVDLLGLGDALPEAGRQPEQREQAGSVEEEGQGRDPPA